MKDILLMQILAEYPRVGKALKLFWGHKEYNEFTDSIFSDDTGTRHGFSQDTMTDLIKLQALHDREFPELAKGEDGWSASILP